MNLTKIHLINLANGKIEKTQLNSIKDNKKFEN